MNKDEICNLKSKKTRVLTPKISINEDELLSHSKKISPENKNCTNHQVYLPNSKNIKNTYLSADLFAEGEQAGSDNINFLPPLV